VKPKLAVSNRRVWLRSVIIPSLIILLLFFAAGWWAVTSIRSLYYDQHYEEAKITAKSYASMLAIALDAQNHFDEELLSTLRLAAAVITRYPQNITDRMLQQLAEDLKVDVIYLFNSDLVITNSNDSTYHGWAIPPSHPLKNFYESGERFFIEEIRADTESGTLYKYGSYRFDDGRLIQVGFKASPIYTQTASFSPQNIIEELSKEDYSTRLALLNHQQMIIAATDTSKVGDTYDLASYGLMQGGDSYRRVRYEGKPYLALRLPLPLDGRTDDFLIVLFDLTRMNWIIHWVSLAISLILLLFFIFFIRSFSKSHRFNQRILHLMRHDDLTGLANSLHYSTSTASPPQALMIIDPLNFKLVNMLYGYSQGDEILKRIAQSLKATTSMLEETTAYRLSDDRFMIAFSHWTSQTALVDLGTSILEEGPQLGLFSHPSFLIGIAMGREASSRETLLKEATIALNAASSANPIQYYNIELEAKLRRIDGIEGELRRVINDEEGLLTVLFQPIYCCSDSRIHSFETLARLNSETLGSIPPDEFIPIAEQQQLITPLGKRIFPLAAELVNALQKAGHDDIRVAVNVSALQLLDRHFISFIREYVAQSGLDTSRVEFELTESSFTEDISTLLMRLEELRAMGFRLAIDDFGTGYSSLSRLRSLPFDTLKLGRSFTQTIDDEKSTLFIKDIISMVHHIGKRVVAEGVENEMQRQTLTRIGCDLLQGYLLAKPVTLDEALRLARKEGLYEDP
jgi:EAL domain-containing protein (putative c-di-GMP-specific phosphodiesterase class I)/GGDEF domain-containing protein